MTKRLALVFALAVTALAAACSSGGGGGNGGGGNGGGGGNSAQATALCKSVSQRYADLYDSCFNVPQGVTTAQTAALCGSSLDKEVASGRARIDETKIQPCLDALSCASLAGAAEPDACKGVVVGQVADGSACYEDGDCKSGGACSFDNACPGKCKGPVPVGGDCFGSLGGCVAGATCVGSGITATCMKVLSPADVCEDQSGPTGQCPSGTTCGAEHDQGGNPICSAGIGKDKPCVDSDGSPVGTCIAGTACIDPANGSSPACSAAPGSGEPCVQDFVDSQWKCNSDSSCVSVAGAFPPSCMTKAPSGGACAGNPAGDGSFPDHPACLSGLTCAGGKCAGTTIAASPKKVGDLCTVGNGECLYGFAHCSSASGKCTLGPALGGDCLDPLADQPAITSIDYPACGFGAYCDSTHKCQAAKPVGATCSGSYAGECGTLADAFCDPQTKKCSPGAICRAP